MRAAAKAAGAVASVVLFGGVAWGYATSLHKEFYALAFGDSPRPVAVPGTSDLAAFRGFVWKRASRDPAFAARWPTEASFDAAAFKEFLALNPYKQVVGIDTVPAGPVSSELEIGRMGSVTPDDDNRNQNRMYVLDGKVVLDPFGRAVPYDPRTLWFGGLTGTASQFDAHGAMIRTGKKGSGVLTAFLHPEQFAMPAAQLGSAPEFSQTYTDLAAIARLRGTPADDWLALSFGANNFHGIEDLGNQIHCTVLGIPEFFVDAKLTVLKQKITGFFKKKPAAGASAVPPAALTTDQVDHAVEKLNAGKPHEVSPEVLYALGKEGGKTPTDVDVGIVIIGNHHRLLEDFFQVEWDKGMAALAAGKPDQCRPEIREVHRRALAGDAAFEAKCRAALAKAGWSKGQNPGQAEFAKVICEVMVEHSAPEAAPIYRAIRKISKPELKRGVAYPADAAGTNPLDWLTTTKSKETDVIFDLHARAFARVVTALRLWREVFEAETAAKPGTPEADAALQRVVDRMVGRQLRYLADAKQRRDEYLREKQEEWKKLNAPKSDGILTRIKKWFR